MQTDKPTTNTSEVTRVEVVDEEGRKYVRHNIENVDLSLQDEGKTLKIFINWNIKNE